MTKYAIVTGASPCSIGFLAAKKLASPDYGYKVILACRNSQKGHEAEELIRFAYPSSEVVYMQLDLGSFESIRMFVDDVHKLDGGAIVDPNKTSGSSLNILVNNAGIGWGQITPFVETSDNLEEIVGVNHFGTFLLTQLLLDDLKRSEDGASIVIVSSSLHEYNERMTKNDNKDSKNNSKGQDEEENDNNDKKKKLVLPNFPDGILQSKENYDGFKAYQISKLCNLWFTYELQRRLDEEATMGSTTTTPSSIIKVNAVSPGFIPTTGLTRRAGWMGIFFMEYILDPWRYIGMGVTRSPEDGAEVIVQAATASDDSGGKYFSLPKGKESVITSIASSDESRDETKAKELWELSLKTCRM
jgi:NAD(P)-dependent dehydrogenase (short-subunit alcohol dehydrogenase family)